MREQIQQIGVAEMSLDEINQEIQQYREGK